MDDTMTLDRLCLAQTIESVMAYGNQWFHTWYFDTEDETRVDTHTEKSSSHAYLTQLLLCPMLASYTFDWSKPFDTDM